MQPPKACIERVGCATIIASRAYVTLLLFMLISEDLSDGKYFTK